MKRYLLIFLLVLTGLGHAEATPYLRGKVKEKHIDPRAVTAGKLGAMPILVRHANGSFASYGTVNDTAAQKGAALISALAVAASGDSLHLVSGRFSVGSTAITVPADVVIHGQGRGATIIASVCADTGAANNKAIFLNDNVSLYNLTIALDNDTGTTVSSVALEQNATAWLFDCEITGYSDGIFQQAADTGAVVHLYRCALSTHYDTINALGDFTVRAYDSDFTVTTSAFDNEGNMRNVAAGNVAEPNTGHTFELYNCRITTTSTDVTISQVFGVMASPTSKIVNCSFSVTSTATPSIGLYDVKASAGAVVERCRGSGIDGTLITDSTANLIWGSINIPVSLTVPPPTSLIITPTYYDDNVSAGHYRAVKIKHDYRVYGTRNLSGTSAGPVVYSAPLTGTFTDNGTSSKYYKLDLSWTAADPLYWEYVVTKTDNLTGQTYSRSYNTAASESYTDSIATDWNANLGSPENRSYPVTYPEQRVHGDLRVLGRLRLAGEGSGGLEIDEGAYYPIMGTVNLASGTATVTTAMVRTDSRIFLSHGALLGGKVGHLAVSAITDNTSFVITSYLENSASTQTADNGTVSWLIIQPAP